VIELPHMCENTMSSAARWLPHPQTDAGFGRLSANYYNLTRVLGAEHFRDCRWYWACAWPRISHPTQPTRWRQAPHALPAK